MLSIAAQRSRELLTGLGLDQIFNIHVERNDRAPPCDDLPRLRRRRVDGGEESEQAQQMLDAHEALCEAAPGKFLAVQRRSRLPKTRPPSRDERTK